MEHEPIARPPNGSEGAECIIAKEQAMMWVWLVLQSIFVIGFTAGLFIEDISNLPGTLLAYGVSLGVLVWIIYRIKHPRSETWKRQRRYDRERRERLRKGKRLKKEIRDCQKKHELDWIDEMEALHAMLDD